MTVLFSAPRKTNARRFDHKNERIIATGIPFRNKKNLFLKQIQSLFTFGFDYNE